jgi:uncharacterized cupin superfamily protein
MPAPRAPAFDPFDVPESNASAVPPPHDAPNRKRFYRRLGEQAGITRFGVNLVRIAPGGQSSFRHWHTEQDEFVWVLEGEVVMVTDAGEQVLTAGTCAGFPHATGDGHQFLNRSAEDVLILVVGDRTPGDAVGYPDDDLAANFVDGRFVFTRKDGSPL